MHVHSTFSDGRDRIEDNIAEAEALGLTALGCVDHVRVDTDWVPDYVAAVQRLRGETAGAAALRHRGQAARHHGRARPAGRHRRRRRDLRRRPPGAAGRRARRIRARCASGSRPATSAPRTVIDAILTSTRARAGPPAARRDRALPQHPAEDRADRGRRARWTGSSELAAETARTGQEIEISERWRCPSAATLRPFLAPRRPDRCSPPTATSATRSAATTHCLAVRRELGRGLSTDRRALEWILTAFVIAGALPLIAGCYQFALAGLHRFRRNAERRARARAERRRRRPAWNEAAVIGRTIDTLLALDYPRRAAARLRRRRREHRRDARRRARARRRRTPAASSTCAASRAARARRTRSTTGCARSAPRAGTRRC